jgi:hypothetical protein
MFARNNVHILTCNLYCFVFVSLHSSVCQSQNCWNEVARSNLELAMLGKIVLKKMQFICLCLLVYTIEKSFQMNWFLCSFNNLLKARFLKCHLMYGVYFLITKIFKSFDKNMYTRKWSNSKIVYGYKMVLKLLLCITIVK